MALTSTSKQISSLKINKVPSEAIYAKMIAQNLINDNELYLISGEADVITGVKGNKETTYRTGNVNLTPADIGALPDTTEIPVVPTNIGAFDNDVGYLTQHQSLTDYPKKTELANVATSGDYTDLINTPTIPSTAGLATETYVQNKIAEVVNSAPGTLDTLNELAQALGNDPNFATTMATELGKKANTANLATVATSGSYNDLSNKPTIPSVGNGTLTIQKNGTSAGTFTANATTDKTINITVPTKVSELTDDVVSGKYLSLTGGTMTGNININNKTITNLKTPTADTEAANKKYVDDQIAANDHTINKFTFTATAGQSTFTIPFNFDDSSALTVYYNGIMMKETDNYTVSGKDITLAGFTAEAGDYLTVMGIEGAAAIDFGQEAANAIAEINATKKSATTEINTIKESATTEINGIKTSAINEINTVKTDTINEINDVVAGLPQDLSSIMSTNKTNTMAANGKITMASTYSPSDSGDIATKKYVDNKSLVAGTSTNYPIYIGSSAPASGTTPLLWIDTTASTGTFKYRTSTTGTWKIVPVAWS